MTAAAASPEAFGPRLSRHLGALAALAWPVMLSRAGILVMALVDVVMLGRYGAAPLAEASLALGLFIPIMVACVGLQMGLLSIVARRNGAGDRAACVAAWRRALPWALLTSGLGAALFAQSGLILSAMGQDTALAAGAGRVAWTLTPGLIFQVLYVTCAFYLEGTGRPKPALAAMAVANLLNVALNWVFIYGRLGAPELGAVGSALATSTVRFCMMAALFAYIMTLPELRTARRLLRGVGLWGPGGWAAGREQRRLGSSAALSLFFETSAYGAMTLIAGLLGTVAVAAYSIAHNVEATVFMGALGLSVATGVRVGGEAGAGRRGEAAFVGWAGLAACGALMAAIGAAIASFAPGLASAYTDDAAVAAGAAGLLPLVALAVVPAGMQIIAGQCNRALGDAYVSSALYGAAYWLVMIPLGAYLALERGLGAPGLVLATAVGAACALALQAARFHYLTRR